MGHDSSRRVFGDVEYLCSDACNGRAPGSRGGLAARAYVRRQLEASGLHVTEQPVPGCDGANLLAHVAGTGPRWVLVGAHYDHLGGHGGRVFRGADDNAAAVALLLELGRALAARPPEGRGVVLAAFDGEEPPHFLTSSMGSMHWARHPSVPLAELDLMVCMDLVGHRLGPDGAPAAVGDSLFVLGAELSEGTGALVDGLARAEPGVVARRAGADVIPPLSDYWAFWQAQVPFAFLTCGRWRHYHTPEDTPDKLDPATLAARARWLERLVRAACARPAARVPFMPEGRDDAASLRSLGELAAALAAQVPLAAHARAACDALLAACDARGHLPPTQRPAVAQLVHALESGLS